MRLFSKLFLFIFIYIVVFAIALFVYNSLGISDSRTPEYIEKILNNELKDYNWNKLVELFNKLIDYLSSKLDII